MDHINIVFISIEGNTRSFIDKLKRYAEQQKSKNDHFPLISSMEVDDTVPECEYKEPFFVFVPTYLSGQNEQNEGTEEKFTQAIGDFLDYENNYKYCLGIIGSGNRNFNNQYCLTARKYSKEFNVPYFDNYELRGTDEDVRRIYKNMTITLKHKLEELGE